MTSTSVLDALIIGSGFAGIGMAIQLQEAGVSDYLILEKENDVGGVWRDNTYPGAACDVPSHLYSFSFAPNPHWTRKYAQQDEIRGYIRRCADQFGVTSQVRFRQEVADATFDEAAGTWTVTTRTGETYRTRALICALGQPNRPAYPRVAGMEDFKGEVFHSALWRHDIDLRGKRVAVIGTGASAIQFVPEIVPQVQSLVLMQRSAPYVIPKSDRAYFTLESLAFDRLPRLLTGSRLWQYWRHEGRALGFTSMKPILKFLEADFRRMLARQVKDPVQYDKLMPRDPFGCKRVLLSNDYYSALTQPHVAVAMGSPRGVDATGITDGEGVRHEVDVIIYGTGFKATEFLAPLRIAGLGGRVLADAWEKGAEAHLGITVSGFPNLFMLYGPNTNLGHSSIIFMLESQMTYIRQCLQKLRAGSLRYLDVKPAAQARFNAEIQESLRDSIWMQGCTSWYVNEHGRNVTNWPGFTVDYRMRTKRPDWSHYRLVG
ncbi:MAG: NAD(P)/FAD-dependent oxidoreductase [Perlucidibaca sp.]